MIKHKTLSTIACLGLVFTAQAAKVDTLSIATTYLDTPESVVVITPDAAAVNPAKRFPTVYMLNGYSGDHLSWISMRPDLPELADSYGVVMVMPDGRDSWYWDSPVDPSMQMESFFTQDLVPYVDTYYPTLTDASKRAITGLSMGGHGALWLAMHHPDIWGNVGSMSGGVDIRPFAEKWKIPQRIGSRDTDRAVWDAYTVSTNIPLLKEAGLNITFDCGADDFFAGVNDNLHRMLLENAVPHDYTSRPGAHSQAYWRNSILYHLLFFNENFKK